LDEGDLEIPKSEIPKLDAVLTRVVQFWNFGFRDF
jgi:hypothetical protein